MLYKNEGSKNCKETQKKSTGRILSVPFEKKLVENLNRYFQGGLKILSYLPKAIIRGRLRKKKPKPID